jgi:hypothetical protein
MPIQIRHPPERQAFLLKLKPFTDAEADAIILDVIEQQRRLKMSWATPSDLRPSPVRWDEPSGLLLCGIYELDLSLQWATGGLTHAKRQEFEAR